MKQIRSFMYSAIDYTIIVDPSIIDRRTHEYTFWRLVYHDTVFFLRYFNWREKQRS